MMKLKILFLALASSTVQADLMQTNETFSFALEDQSRGLEKSKNENCNISGEISCKVIGDNRDCRDLNIRKDKCKELPIMMNYTFCNNQQLPAEKVIIIPSLSFQSLYEKRNRLSFATLPAGTCKSELRRGVVDTCTRNRVNADMKLEGWKSFTENFGNYCHLYKHYFPRINRFTLAPTPSPHPAPKFNVIIMCFLEDFKGSENYIVPCEDMDIDYFLNSHKSESIDFERNVMYKYIIQSLAGETIKVEEISATLDDETFIIEDPEGSRFIEKGESVTVAKFTKNVDFSDFSGEDFGISSDITVTGLKSGMTSSITETDSFTVPIIEFRWRILPDVECIIKETNQSCEDYIASLPISLDDPDLCMAEVQYTYKVESNGEACGDIKEIAAAVDGASISIQFDDWEFCPGGISTVVDTRSSDLCDFAGREIEFDLKLNGEEGNPTATFVAFPTPSADGPELSMSNFRCEIFNSNPKRSCADYIKFQLQENLPCVTDVVYRAKIENIGDTCFDINKLKLGVDSTLFPINVKNWSPEKKDFCPNEKKLNLKKKVLDVDLCQFADQEVDIQVIAINDSKVKLKDAGSIQFPKPNSVTPAPAPAPAPAPSLCTTKPNSITIKLNRDVCADSSNSQGIKRTRKLNRKSKGKGSKPKTCECEECVDHSVDITAMAAPPMVIISKKNTDGSTMELFKGDIDFSTDFVFTPPTMPDCLQIDIREKDGVYTRRSQIVGFDMTCSVGSPLNVGDTFGAIEIVKIN